MHEEKVAVSGVLDQEYLGMDLKLNFEEDLETIWKFSLCCLSTQAHLLSSPCFTK